jgi:hypothetical protein
MTDAPPFRRRLRAAQDARFLLLAALAAVILMYLARSMTFWQDEWGAITFSGGPLDFIRPVNEHWSTIPLLMYRATFGIVGLHSYLPYIAQVIALHLLAVAAAYVLVRARGGPTVATLACIPLLLLGSGSENLFWAFQTGFVGSVAFGLWALVLIERPGRAAGVGASLLLIASLMSSGMGLFFLVAAFGRTILDPDIRRRVTAVIPPTVVYLAWYVTVGHEPVTTAGHLAGFTAVPGFVLRGIGHAVGAFTGLELLSRGDLLAITLFGFAVLATASAAVTNRRPPALAAGSLLAIVAMYVVIGLVRAQLESDFATRSRYVYVAAFFLVIALIDWLPRLRDRADRRQPGRLVLVAVLFAILVATTVANIAAFGPIRGRFQSNADLTRAYIGLALAHKGETWIDPQSVLPEMPPLPELIATVERYGSPLRDDLIPAVVTDPGARAREAALLRMVGSGFRAEAGTAVNAASAPRELQVTELADATATWEGGCLSLADAGGRAAVSAEVETGTRLRIEAPGGVDGRAILGLALPPSRPIDIHVVAGAPLDVVVPDVGDGSIWAVRVEIPNAAGTVRICRIDGP